MASIFDGLGGATDAFWRMQQQAMRGGIDNPAYPGFCPPPPSHSELVERQQREMRQEHIRKMMEMDCLRYPHAFNSGATSPLQEKKPNLDTMRPLDYLRARNREWLEGVEI